MGRIKVHSMSTPMLVSAETIILAQMLHKWSEATERMPRSKRQLVFELKPLVKPL
jgi:hypothetical protein